MIFCDKNPSWWRWGSRGSVFFRGQKRSKRVRGGEVGYEKRLKSLKIAPAWSDALGEAPGWINEAEWLVKQTNEPQTHPCFLHDHLLGGVNCNASSARAVVPAARRRSWCRIGRARREGESGRASLPNPATETAPSVLCSFLRPREMLWGRARTALTDPARRGRGRRLF